MNICLLTFYYKPDLCAGSFRNTALVEEFKSLLNKDDHLDVITTLPNRYASYKVSAQEYEKEADNIEVYRVSLPEHKSGFKDQIVSFKAFYEKAQNLVKEKKYDLVIASSSRLFTAFLGARISRKKSTPLYLDIRDLFRENMQEILTSSFKSIPIQLLKKIENYTFGKANRINIVSEGFRADMEKYGAELSFYPNGIDEFFMDYDFSLVRNGSTKKVITYAGNIGDGQGLDKIIPQTAKEVEDSDYLFRIIGDGGARSNLEKELKDRKLKNVELIEPVNRDKLVEYYKKTDYLFLHLNDYDAFKKVLPSKVFEYAVTEKPIFAGVKGYSRNFLKDNVDGIFLFDPCDVKSFTEALKKEVLPMGATNRDLFKNKFARRNIMRDMANQILTEFRD